MAHTPGPWNYAELKPDGDIVRKCNTYEISTPSYDVCTLNPYGGPIRKEDDARLIAAAPDMLEALENIENDDGHMPASAWELIQKAIAKARGES